MLDKGAKSTLVSSYICGPDRIFCFSFLDFIGLHDAHSTAEEQYSKQ